MILTDEQLRDEIEEVRNYYPHIESYLIGLASDVAQAEHEATLKVVGGYLTGFGDGFDGYKSILFSTHTEIIESLLRGEMPKPLTS